MISSSPNSVNNLDNTSAHTAECELDVAVMSPSQQARAQTPLSLQEISARHVFVARSLKGMLQG